MLHVTKTKMDICSSHSSTIKDCIENTEEILKEQAILQNIRKNSSAKKRIKTTRDASDWLNVDYKLKIMGVNNIEKQEDEPGIFDMNDMTQSIRSMSSQ